MKGVAENGEYLLYKLSDRQVLAVPANPKNLRKSALQRLQPSTRKRAAFRAIVGWSMIAGIDWLFCRPVQSPLEAMPPSAFGWTDWLGEMRQYFGISGLSAATFWPTQVERGRLYVHLLDTEGCPIAFAKISLSSESSDNARLSREADALRELGARCLRTFRVPRLLMQDTKGGHSYLLLESLPTSARPIARKLDAYPDECVEEYAGPLRYCSLDMVSRLSWWDQYLGQLDEHCQAFHNELTSSLQGTGIRVCRAHGDLSRHNIVQNGRTLWIYDWEESVPDAPARTDALGFAIALNQAGIRKNPVSWARTFKRRYLENVQVDVRAEFMMALAFRHAAGMDDATLIIQNWNRS